jgi:hypothetical protein
LLETLEGLLEDATDDLLLHATGPCIVHDVCGTSCVHEAESDVYFMAVQPASSDAKDVWMLGEGHELCLPLEKAQRALWKSVEVENLEGTWYRRALRILRVVRRLIDDGRRAKSDPRSERIIFCSVAAIDERLSEPNGPREDEELPDLKSCHSSWTAPIKGAVRESEAMMMAVAASPITKTNAVKAAANLGGLIT